MSIAQQIIAQEIARAMVITSVKAISGESAWAALSPAARIFAQQAAANVDAALNGHGVPVAEIMEGIFVVDVVGSDGPATDETLVGTDDPTLQQRRAHQ